MNCGFMPNMEDGATKNGCGDAPWMKFAAAGTLAALASHGDCCQYEGVGWNYDDKYE